MISLSNEQRRRVGWSGIGVTAVALLAAFAIPGRSQYPSQREHARIEQFRANPTASTGGGELPTFATLAISFPARLGLHSTEVVELVYARFFATSGDEFITQNGEMKLVPGKPKPGSPFKTLPRPARVPLDSSALTIAPAIAVLPKDAPLPHTFRWTITPRQAGDSQIALLDLSDLISPTGQPSIFGTTEITVGGKPAELRGGTQLILPFTVVDDANRHAWIWKAISGIPGFIGFVISYPLFVDWLKKRLRKRRPRPATSARPVMPVAPEASPAPPPSQTSTPEPSASRTSSRSSIDLPEFPFPLIAVAGRRVEQEWRACQAKWRLEGASAVVLGDAQQVKEISEAMRFNEASAESYLAAAKGMSSADFFARKTAAFAEDEVTTPQGEWPGPLPGPDLGAHLDVLSRKPKANVFIARIPTANAWEIPAHLKFGGWNDCPSPEQQVVVLQYWAEQYGIEVYAITGDVLECVVARPPETQATAIALAEEQFLYCSDIVHQECETISNLAATLQDSTVWYFWWD